MTETISLSLAPHQPAIDAALADLDARSIVARIWQHDPTVWGHGPREVVDRLDWLHSAQEMSVALPRLAALPAAWRDAGFEQALLLGMGGSSLAPEVYAATLAAEPGLSLAVLDSTDPAAVLAYADRFDPRRTLFIVSSKSGTTVEMLSFFQFFYNRCADVVAEPGRHFIAITDPASHLAGLAVRYGFADLFLNNPNIGGRYSALSFFGLVPAALVGADVARLLDGARAMAAACGPCAPAAENPAALLGAVLGELANAGRDKATFFLSPGLLHFGDWLEQLIAESSGKDGRGILPVVGEPPGAPEVYRDDRLFVALGLAGELLPDAELMALERAGHPVLRMTVPERYDLGGQMLLWELATAVAGQRMGIQPFDQPDVEAAKRQARRLVDEYKAHGALPVDEAAPLSAATLAGFLAQPGDYVAIHAYLPPAAPIGAALAALRLRLRDRCRLATTVGYGPRFLHSTGQLYKGDAGRGLFIQLTADAPRDAAIPDQAGAPESSLTFGLLETAQAAGDRRAMEEAGRRVIRFHLGADVAGGLERLVDWAEAL